MKIQKLLMLCLVVSIAIVACNPDDPPGPTSEFRLDENQSNWTKRFLLQRPPSDLPSSLPGMFSQAETKILYNSGDTVTVGVNLYQNIPYSIIATSYTSGISWLQSSSINGLFKSSIQDGEKCYGLRYYLGETQWGDGYQYGRSWDWHTIVGNPDKLIQISGDTILAYGSDGIRRTTDAGTTWTIASTEIATSIAIYNDSMLIGAFGSDIMVSSNMGSSWSLLYTATNTPNTLFRAPDGSWLAGCTSGSILRSTDLGNNWSQVFLLTQQYSNATLAEIKEIHFLDSQNGFAVVSCLPAVNCGDSFDAMTGCILRTVDSGNTWTVNYRSEFIRYTGLISSNGPHVIATGIQAEDNILTGVYITITTSLGN
ncbi:MAG: hypothetical protein CVU11_05335 [Bacteroidetes bacterium HGW-Bacteroidetes-6]|jgi:hypothetical protein|nr:MAG: hypothetical protein CVU11_05335 [Bacteroidetes bacterium HGW-Bacteroidetes-6]